MLIDIFDTRGKLCLLEEDEFMLRYTKVGVI